VNQHVDSTGRTWQFAYWGTGFVYIRELWDDGTQTLPIGGTRSDWPFVIGLNDWMQRPETVTGAWLDEHSARWIKDRNEDIAAGNITN
jgi:hypothetical protein